MADKPRMIGPYRVERLLGSGGMGVVYAAVEPGTGRLVAVKVIRPEWAADPALRARLRREAAAAGRVPRSCTAAVIGADVDADPPYIATEYISGPTLDVRVLEKGPLHSDPLIELATGVAVALQAVHDCGVLHRDLKPSNIVLSPAGPRVIDFGIARIDDAETEITKAGGIIGTPAYMAPEQLRGRKLTKAADVFAWAGVIAYAVTGLPPFGTDARMRDRIQRADPVLPALPDVLDDLVRRAFALDPTDRPTAAELVEALTRDSAPASQVVRKAAVAPERRIRVGSGLRSKGGARPLLRTSIVVVAMLTLMILAASWFTGVLRGATEGTQPDAEGPPLPGEPLLGHKARVSAVAAATLKGRPILVSGGDDDQLRVWDLTTRTQLRHMRFANGIHTIATGNMHGRPIAVAAVHTGDRGRFGLGSLGTTVCAFDLTTGEEVLKKLSGRQTRAVAIDSRAIYHSGSHGGNELSGRPMGIERADLTTGRALPGLPVPDYYVEGLASGTVNGRPIIVSIESTIDTRRARMLDISSRTVLRSLKPPDAPREVRLGRVGGRTIAVISHDKGLLLWDLSTGRRTDIPLPYSPAIAVGELTGRPVVISGQAEGPLIVWDLATARRLRTIQISPLTPRALTMTEIDNKPFIVIADGRAWPTAESMLRLIPL